MKSSKSHKVDIAGKGLRFEGTISGEYYLDRAKGGNGWIVKFYNGVSESDESTILKDLRIKWNEKRLFNGELSKLRTTNRLEVAKREKKFMDAVRDLDVSLNRIFSSR